MRILVFFGESHVASIRNHYENIILLPALGELFDFSNESPCNQMFVSLVAS